MSFKDIFSSDFLSNVTAISPLDMIIALGLAVVIGLFIMMVYKKTFKGVMYSKAFGTSLLAMTIITTFIILGVTSNVVLSLGMVGALSIVRFRSAVKEPIDIAYLFWAISEGIVLGAGLIELAVIGAILIGIIMVVCVNKDSMDNPYVLVVNCNNEKAENEILESLKKDVKKYIIKSKTVSDKTGIEITVEVKLNDMATDFVNKIGKIKDVNNAVLVSYNGDYMG